MRRTKISMLAASVVALSACGSSTSFSNKPRPPTPVNVTVYVNDVRVSVSPSSVGAGPIVLVVTNQSSKSQSLSVLPTGGDTSQALADTGPISPQATAQVTVNVSSSGNYTIAAGQHGTSEAALATTSPIQSATLHIGPPRASGSNSLLQP
jgi:hypothetical protein